MFILKEKFDYDKVCSGGLVTIDLDKRKFRFVCPRCGKKVKASSQEIVESLCPSDDKTSAYCFSCSEKMAEREADDADDDSLADMLIDDLIDTIRDKDGAQRFVYLRDKGIIVDIDHCKVPELIDAVITGANREIEDLDASLALCQKRIEELKKTAPEPVWRVTWNDHEGNEQERRFHSIQDAVHEVVALEEKFDGVQVFDADGNPV